MWDLVSKLNNSLFFLPVLVAVFVFFVVFLIFRCGKFDVFSSSVRRGLICALPIVFFGVVAILKYGSWSGEGGLFGTLFLFVIFTVAPVVFFTVWAISRAMEKPVINKRRLIGLWVVGILFSLLLPVIAGELIVFIFLFWRFLVDNLPAMFSAVF